MAADPDTSTDEEFTERERRALKHVAKDALDKMPNRRSFLAGLTGAAAAGAVGYNEGVSQAKAAASTSDGDGDVGTPSSPVDVFADGVDAVSVGADQLLGAWPTRIMALDATGVAASIDPANSTTPVQDAIDAIGTGNGGRIVLPPTTFSDAGNWTGLGYKSLLGTWRQTRINLTDETVPVINVGVSDDLQQSYIDGVMFHNNTTPRTAPAIDWNAATKMANMGRVLFNNFSGDDIFSWTGGTGTGMPWSSHYEFVRARFYNRFINWGGADPVGVSIANCYLGSDDSATPEIEKTDNNATGTVWIGSWNKGQVACPMFVGQGGTDNSSIVFGHGNYEPSTSATIDQIFKFVYKLRAKVGPFKTSGSFTLNKAEIVAANNQGTMQIMAHHPLFIESDNAGPLPYVGASSSVTKGSGTPTSLTHGVAALGDLTLVT